MKEPKRVSVRSVGRRRAKDHVSICVHVWVCECRCVSVGVHAGVGVDVWVCKCRCVVCGCVGVWV